MQRKKDRWPELCELVAEDDELPVRNAGTWTKDKLYCWNRYLEITTTAMVGKPHWSAIVYVDLFAGPGVLKLKESGQRIPGSVLLAANTPKPFDRLLVCEKDQATAHVLQKRLTQHNAIARSKIFVGDCNEQIDGIISEIPERSLTLAFIDPEGLHAHFDTLRKLASGRRVDLLILLADRMDAVRNIESVYKNQTDSNLDKVLGPGCHWRKAYDSLPNRDAASVCLMLENLFCEQLKKQLQYEVFGGQVMRSSRSAIYRIVYASKSTKGGEFWEKISKIDSQGQMTLPFD